MSRLTLVLLVITLMVTACTQKPSPAATPAPPAPTAIAKSTVPAPAATAPSGTPSIPTEAPSTLVTPAAFFLEVLAPQNESVVRTATVEVQGRTVPDAVVSVNGQPVELDANGRFSTTVRLLEGPNTVDVVASDFQGHQEGKVLTIIYTL